MGGVDALTTTPVWSAALPAWATQGDSQTGRVLLKLKMGDSTFSDDVQTKRILSSIDDIRRRRRPPYHEKMREVDVADLRKLEEFHSAPPVQPLPRDKLHTLQESTPRLAESRFERGLGVLEGVARLSLEYAAPWASIMPWPNGL